jgi:anti-sigma regulatory factor (Ser/Thr protein kinase)
VAAGEPVLVAVSPFKAKLIKDELNGEAGAVYFADMPRLGRNPARIISAWHDFVAEHLAEGFPVRGIGEHVWPGRSEAELVECQRHEWLVNLAFADAPAWWLMCPYDAAALDGEIIDDAHVTHPYIADRAGSHASDSYRDPETSTDPFHDPLPPPASEPEELTFCLQGLGTVRLLVSRYAADANLGGTRADDLLIAVNELATNSVLHGGGLGTVGVWLENDALMCEVRDAGCIDDPLAGGERPPAGQPDGRGLWLMNQLCDLAQIRSRPQGTVVRLRMDLN